MNVILDRWEEGYAVVEIQPGRFACLPKELIPEAKEGDVIRIEVDRSETEARKKQVTRLMDRLFED